MKRFFQRISPQRETLLRTKLLRPIAHLLADPRLWHFNRRSVAGGLAIGIFFAFLPIPMQMLLASILAIFWRVNLPIAVISTWVTNPFTMPVVYAACFFLGEYILGSKAHFPDLLHGGFNVRELSRYGVEVIVPLALGSVLLGLFFAILAYIVVRSAWRYHVYRYHEVRRTRREKPIQKPSATNTTSTKPETLPLPTASDKEPL